MAHARAQQRGRRERKRMKTLELPPVVRRLRYFEQPVASVIAVGMMMMPSSGLRAGASVSVADGQT
jgi:hypothetical protein